MRNWIVNLFLLGLIGCSASKKSTEHHPTVPDWATEVIWYQIFPERFRNGDTTNDPTRSSIEFFDKTSEDWRISPWTGDWYALDEWGKKQDGFYDIAVFLRRYGGDLQGVLDGIPYLDSLGITGIYFNPVFYARSLHKYDASSYHHIDPYFGPNPQADLALMEQETSDPKTWHWTEADKLFLKVLQEAHHRDIRVIIDGVFNHSGRDFFAFKDLAKHQEASPYADWYIVKSFDNPETPENEFAYKGWWDVDTLPVFADVPDGNDLHHEVKTYLFNITKRWMDPNQDGNTSDGIDGWRLDVTEEIPIQFWKDWNVFVRQINPEAYTVTEIWGDAHEMVNNGGFSATMNYFGFGIPVHDFLIDGRMKASTFAEQLDTARRAYSLCVAMALQNLIDSHDTDRLASMIVNASQNNFDREVSPRWSPEYEVRKPNQREREIQRMIALFQMSYLGAPMLYYGTEAGMWGADDPDDRKPMMWPDMEFEDEKTHPKGKARTSDSVSFDDDLFQYYQMLIRMRKEHETLSKGRYDFWLADDKKQLFGFKRFDEDNTFYIILNRSEIIQQIMLPENAVIIANSHRDESAVRIEEKGEVKELTVPPLTGVILLKMKSDV